MLIDDLVLDVTDFINLHPGGRFLIRHTIGSDISKFFFGGYCLEGNLTNRMKGHNHSAYAKMIVNDLVIAIFEGDLPATTEIV